MWPCEFSKGGMGIIGNIKGMLLIKIVSVVISILLILQQTDMSQASELFGLVEMKSEFVPIEVKGAHQSIDSAYIQESFSSKVKKDDESMIIHLQDAHASLSAQYTLVDILDTLVTRYDLRLIALEGGDGYIDTSILKTFPDKVVRDATSDYLLRQGVLSAAEFFSLTRDNDEVVLYGVEDDEMYQKNLNSFCSVSEDREKYIRISDSFIYQLQILEDAIYSKKLKDFNGTVFLHRDKKISFMEYLASIRAMTKKCGVNISEYKEVYKLAETIELEKEIDFILANNERGLLVDKLTDMLSNEELEELLLSSARFKEGKMSKSEFHSYLTLLAYNHKVATVKYENFITYSKYISLYESINMIGLYDEIKELENSIREKLYTDIEERRLYGLVHMLYLFKQLYSLEISNRDYRILKEQLSIYNPKNIVEFIKEKCAKYNVEITEGYDVKEMFSGLSKACEFYEVAEARDNVMINNTIKQMKAENKQVAALITGGFHTAGLTDVMKREGLSYLVVVPKFEKDENRPYIAVLTKKNKHYQEILNPAKYNIAVEAYFNSGGNVEKFAKGIAYAIGVERLRKNKVEMSRIMLDWQNIYKSNWQSFGFSERSREIKSSLMDPVELFKFIKLFRVIKIGKTAVVIYKDEVFLAVAEDAGKYKEYPLSDEIIHKVEERNAILGKISGGTFFSEEVLDNKSDIMEKLRSDVFFDEVVSRVSDYANKKDSVKKMKIVKILRANGIDLLKCGDVAIKSEIDDFVLRGLKALKSISEGAIVVEENKSLSANIEVEITGAIQSTIPEIEKAECSVVLKEVHEETAGNVTEKIIESHVDVRIKIIEELRGFVKIGVYRLCELVKFMVPTVFIILFACSDGRAPMSGIMANSEPSISDESGLSGGGVNLLLEDTVTEYISEQMHLDQGIKLYEVNMLDGVNVYLMASDTTYESIYEDLGSIRLVSFDRATSNMRGGTLAEGYGPELTLGEVSPYDGYDGYDGLLNSMLYRLRLIGGASNGEALDNILSIVEDVVGGTDMSVSEQEGGIWNLSLNVVNKDVMGMEYVFSYSESGTLISLSERYPINDMAWDQVVTSYNMETGSLSLLLPGLEDFSVYSVEHELYQSTLVPFLEALNVMQELMPEGEYREVVEWVLQYLSEVDGVEISLMEIDFSEGAGPDSMVAIKGYSGQELFVQYIYNFYDRCVYVLWGEASKQVNLWDAEYEQIVRKMANFVISNEQAIKAEEERAYLMGIMIELMREYGYDEEEMKLDALLRDIENREFNDAGLGESELESFSIERDLYKFKYVKSEYGDFIEFRGTYFIENKEKYRVYIYNMPTDSMPNGSIRVVSGARCESGDSLDLIMLFRKSVVKFVNRMSGSSMLRGVVDSLLFEIPDQEHVMVEQLISMAEVTEIHYDENGDIAGVDIFKKIDEVEGLQNILNMKDIEDIIKIVSTTHVIYPEAVETIKIECIYKDGLWEIGDISFYNGDIGGTDTKILVRAVGFNDDLGYATWKHFRYYCYVEVDEAGISKYYEHEFTQLTYDNWFKYVKSWEYFYNEELGEWGAESNEPVIFYGLQDLRELKILGSQGKIKHIAVVASDFSDKYKAIWEVDIKNLLKQLPEEVKISIIPGYDISEDEIIGMHLEDSERVSILIPSLDYAGSFTPWIRDVFVVGVDGVGNTSLYKTREESVTTSSWQTVNPETEYDPYISLILKDEYGFKFDYALDYDGGDIVPIGNDYVLLGKSKPAPAMSREPIVIASPYEKHHIDIVFSDGGNNTVVVGDPRKGWELFGEVGERQYDEFIERIKEVSSEEDVDTSLFQCEPENMDEDAKQLDDIAERLEREYGFNIVRIPVVPLDKYLVTYNNVIFSETESEKNVYLLKYGLDLVDDEAERVWRDLGYNVKWVESSLAPFLTGGGLRCMTNILELEEVHIESFDESEDVSAVESMSVMGWYDEFGLSGISGFLQKIGFMSVMAVIFINLFISLSVAGGLRGEFSGVDTKYDSVLSCEMGESGIVSMNEYVSKIEGTEANHKIFGQIDLDMSGEDAILRHKDEGALLENFIDNIINWLKGILKVGGVGLFSVLMANDVQAAQNLGDVAFSGDIFAITKMLLFAGIVVSAAVYVQNMIFKIMFEQSEDKVFGISVGVPEALYNELVSREILEDIVYKTGIDELVPVKKSESLDAMLDELAVKTSGKESIVGIIDEDAVARDGYENLDVGKLETILADFVRKAEKDIVRLMNPEIASLDEFAIEKIANSGKDLKGIVGIYARTLPEVSSLGLLHKSVYDMRINNIHKSVITQRDILSGNAKQMVLGYERRDKPAFISISADTAADLRFIANSISDMGIDKARASEFIQVRVRNANIGKSNLAKYLKATGLSSYLSVENVVLVGEADNTLESTIDLVRVTFKDSDIKASMVAIGDTRSLVQTQADRDLICSKEAPIFVQMDALADGKSTSNGIVSQLLFVVIEVAANDGVISDSLGKLVLVDGKSGKKWYIFIPVPSKIDYAEIQKEIARYERLLISA